MEIWGSWSRTWGESWFTAVSFSRAHLTVDLDGPTLSDNPFSGPIGKLIDSATDVDINPNFPLDLSRPSTDRAA